MVQLWVEVENALKTIGCDALRKEANSTRNERELEDHGRLVGTVCRKGQLAVLREEGIGMFPGGWESVLPEISSCCPSRAFQGLLPSSA